MKHKNAVLSAILAAVLCFSIIPVQKVNASFGVLYSNLVAGGNNVTNGGYTPTFNSTGTMNVSSVTLLAAKWTKYGAVNTFNVTLTFFENATSNYSFSVTNIPGSILMDAGGGSTPNATRGVIGFSLPVPVIVPPNTNFYIGETINISGGGDVAVGTIPGLLTGSLLSCTVYGSTTGQAAPVITDPSVALNAVSLTLNNAGFYIPTFNVTVTDDGGEPCSLTLKVRDVTWASTVSVTTNVTGLYSTNDTINPTAYAYLSYGHSYYCSVIISNSAGSIESAALVVTPSPAAAGINNQPPVVQTDMMTTQVYSTNASANLKGYVFSDGNTTTNVSFRYRLSQAAYITTYNWTYTVNQTGVTGSTYSQWITGLNTSAQYEYEFIGTNAFGTSTGGIGQLIFGYFGSANGTTVAPVNLPNRITQFKGYVTNTGNQSVYWSFEYRRFGTTEWIPTDSSFAVPLAYNSTPQYVSFNQTGLIPATQYDVRMILNVDSGRTDCNIITFLTARQPILELLTGNITPISISSDLGAQPFTSYTVMGSVTEVWPSASIWFQYHIGAPVSIDSASIWTNTAQSVISVAGNYTAVLADLPVSGQFCYRFVGNTSDGVFVKGGQYTLTVTPAPTVSPNGTTTQPPPAGTITWPGPDVSFSDFINSILARWGMNNTLGHWAFLMIVEAVLLAIFSIPIIYLIVKKEKFIAKVLAFILGIIAVAVFGAFIWSGFLGIWAVGVLIVLVVGIVMLVFTGRTTGNQGV